MMHRFISRSGEVDPVPQRFRKWGEPQNVAREYDTLMSSLRSAKYRNMPHSPVRPLPPPSRMSVQGYQHAATRRAGSYAASRRRHTLPLVKIVQASSHSASGQSGPTPDLEARRRGH